MGEKLSLGFPFWYGIRGNLRIYGLRPSFTFAKLREHFGIAVSPTTIWGKILREEIGTN